MYYLQSLSIKYMFIYVEEKPGRIVITAGGSVDDE